MNLKEAFEFAEVKDVKTILCLENKEEIVSLFPNAEIDEEFKKDKYDLIVTGIEHSYNRYYDYCGFNSCLAVIYNKASEIRMSIVKAGFNLLYELDGVTIAKKQ